MSEKSYIDKIMGKSRPKCPKSPPCVYGMPETPDGFFEVNLDVNGSILATRIMSPYMTQDDAAEMINDFAMILQRRC